jgi:all-trans-retinol 13,14-reductase
LIVGKYFKEDNIKDCYNTIIIGSGIGALTCGRLLAELGEKVLILEKHYTAGGLTHTFTRKNYEWDTGVHYIGEVHNQNHPLRMLFDYLSGHNLKWNKMDEEYDRLIFPDKEYSFISGRDNLSEKLMQDFSKKEDRKAVKDYLTTIKNVTDAGTSLCMARALPNYVNSLSFNYLLKKANLYSKKTTLEALKSLNCSPKLIGVLTGQYANYGLPPGQSSFLSHGIVSYHYLEGGNYPVGGGSSIADTITTEIEARGGQVITRMGVKEILIKDGKAIGVLLDNNQTILAEKIISNAGVHNTFSHLVKDESESKTYIRKMKSLRYSTGYFSLNLGFSKSGKELKMPKTNYWFLPGYDHDLNVKNYFENQTAEVPLSYVSFASTKDPSWDDRYPNKSTIDILGAASYKWFEKWQNGKVRNRGDEYQKLKEDMARPYLEKLFEYMPHLSSELDYYEISTPLTVKTYCHYERGETYGLAASKERFNGDLIRPKTPIKNLYITGQDLVMGGVCGAMVSGAVTTMAIYPLKGFKLLKSIGFFNKVY